MLILTTSNLTARLKTKIPVSGGQKISHEIEAMCATQPASPRWRPNHEILWHRKIAGHKPAGMTRLVCVLLSSNAIIQDGAENADVRRKLVPQKVVCIFIYLYDSAYS